MLWVMLPAYNEAESLPKLLPKMKQALEEKNVALHIVVVNDGRSCILSAHP